MSYNQLKTKLKEYNLLEIRTIIISYKSFKHLILAIIINFNCQQFDIIR